MLSFTRHAIHLTKQLRPAVRAKSELNNYAASTSIKSYVEVMFYSQIFPTYFI